MGSAPGVALVTGASRGIGQVVAGRLVASGHRVALAARSADRVTAAAQEIGGLPLVLDVTDQPAVEAAIATVERELGPITLLVNNAGSGGEGGDTWDQTAGAWWQVFEVNVLGTLLCSRAVIPGMRARGHGRIVNVASNAAFFSLADGPVEAISSAYMASKAAVVRFSEALASEARADGIQVFAISPGTVKTDMAAAIFQAEWDDPSFWTPPELVADLIEFIDSGALDELSGRYIHAQHDDWRALPERFAEILENDRMSLRVT
jgi:3-oxoacyl-[acyl-carrier protein] reductase